MKKIFTIIMLALTFVSFSGVICSCDKEDDDPYYAGESEEDFKPNIYTIESKWDLSACQGLTSSEKETIANQLSKGIEGSEEFPTREAAVSAFDEAINELRQVEGIPGLKGTIYLKRRTAIIKQATLKW
ncbi:MAG: hypothetical protein K2K84_01880 [Muribaculaceae bacterium]|nr:hypothetical protein [Muribaculaceae bacterium]